MVQFEKDNMVHHKYNCMDYMLVDRDRISLDQHKIKVYKKLKIQWEDNAIIFDDV
jgi:hypothetical protein